MSIQCNCSLLLDIFSMHRASLIPRVDSHRHLQWSRQLEITPGAPSLLSEASRETLSSCQVIYLKYENTKALSSPTSSALSYLFCPLPSLLPSPIFLSCPLSFLLHSPIPPALSHLSLLFLLSSFIYPHMHSLS